MKNKVLDLVKNHKNSNRIIEFFKEQFEIGYHNLDSYKEGIFTKRDTLFRKWYYSTMLDQTYITPNFYINQLAQNHYKGEYVVMPHIKPVSTESKEIDYVVDFKYFSLTEHPVIKDLEILVDNCTPSATIREGDPFLFENGDELLNRINYRNGYYLDYLISLAFKLKLLKEIPAIGCKCLSAVEKSSFYDLSNEEKLIEIVDKSIDFSFDMFNNIPLMHSKLKRVDILKMLNNGWVLEEHMNQAKKNAVFMNDMVGVFMNSEICDDDQEELLNEMGEDAGTMMAYTYHSMFIDLCFVSVFGYYLNIITPAYHEIYDMATEIQVFEQNQYNSEVIQELMFKWNTAHDLSPIGKVIMKKFNKKPNEEVFESMTNEDLEEILEEAEKELEDIKEGVFDRDKILENLDVFLKDGNTGDEFSKVLSMFGIDEDDCEEDYDECEAVNNHLGKFVQYLYDEKNLKRSTIEKHEKNVYLLYDIYLNRNCNMTPYDIKGEVVKEYLGVFFIRSFASSKTAVGDQVASLKHYANFLLHEKIIDNEIFEDIKGALKSKDFYIKKYEEYWNDDEDGWYL